MATSLLSQAQQAWEQALGQLRYTINRADFDAWLRAARPLAYDGQVLTVGVANAYARDWLADRLRSTLERQLRGLLNAPVQIVFVVADPASTPDVSNSGTTTTNGTTVPQAQEDSSEPSPRLETPSPAEPHAKSTPSPAKPTKAGLDLQALSLRLRDAFLQSQRVVFVPGYFLRWLPYLGSRAGWLYVALRQTYFLANVAPYGPGQRIPPGQALEVPRASLAHWSHLTKRTINNILNQGLLAPLVTVERNRHRDAHRQAPNRYIFTADLPLTPADREHVLAALEAYGLQTDPVAALAHALQQPPQSLLAPTPARATAPTDPAPDRPTSLRAAVGERLRGAGLPSETFAKVLGMAELLETSLIDSEGKLFISWYFIEHHLPILGHTVAWLYLVARHRAQRQGHMAANGFRVLDVTTREVAGWVGLKKARYGRDLIPQTATPAAPTRDDPREAAFLHRAASRGNTFPLYVQTLEPLTPTDQAAYDLALHALAVCIQRDNLTALQNLQSAHRQGDSTRAQEILTSLVPSEALATHDASAPASEQVLPRALQALAALSLTSNTTETKPPKISPGSSTSNAQTRQKFPSEPPKDAPGSAKNFPQPGQNLPSDSAKNFPHFNHVNPEKQTSINAEENHQTRAGGEANHWTWEHLLPHLQIAPQTAQKLQTFP
ncbi:MAG: hypothetical protein GXO56_05360, partial [Chloroflexi bacterium]|nr:hypothetical protein [Chloroflexota bacterium]